MPYKHENVFGGELSSCQENMSRTQWVYVCTTLCSIDLSWSASDRRVCTALPLADDVCAPVVRSISATADNGEICGKNIALLRPRQIRPGLDLLANELVFQCEDQVFSVRWYLGCFLMQNITILQWTEEDKEYLIWTYYNKDALGCGLWVFSKNSETETVIINPLSSSGGCGEGQQLFQGKAPFHNVCRNVS